MEPSYKQTKKNKLSRESIIGLGESSVRKNYFPELQEKLLALEHINVRNRAILTAMPDILLVSDTKGRIAPFSLVDADSTPLILDILNQSSIMSLLRTVVKEVVKHRQLMTANFTLEQGPNPLHFEARLHISELDEVLIIIRDITDQVLLEDQLREAAEIDTLTGLKNRGSFERKLLTYNASPFNNLSIILLDIDGLKLINDTLGHLAGDDLICAMANIISEHFETLGFTSRIGGDEFGVILENQDPSVTETILNALTESVARYNENSDTLKITLSFGLSHHSEGLVDTRYLYQVADNNMYQNKLLKTASTRHNTVKTLMKALEVRDFITEGHADRMGDNAKAMGMALSLGQNMINRLELLTKFHDIGKVGISDTILNKPAKLTAEEYTIMKTHSAIGERIANESSELKDIAHLILKHHENWDGSGYPLGLAYDDIPIECRILSIVDTYDAMTNDRPYRQALGHQVAIDELKKCAGSQFDPTLVEIFVELFSDDSI